MKYMIYCAAGAGGLFLTSIVAKFLEYSMDPIISRTGHCHDLGKGNWKGHNDVVNFIGDHWKINFNPSSKIFYTHVLPIDKFKEISNLKVILIDIDFEDYYNVTKLYVCKAWPDILTYEEYLKWKGVDWPEYSKNIISNLELVQNELIVNLCRQTEEWMTNYNRQVVDYTINFKTVLGINNKNLADELSNILNKPATTEIKNLITEYQSLNKRLYFNAENN
jgi:hypothetical protein